jgi:8-oxo-dGTP pyrophosphatase MutT (NUDIX family)
MKIADIFSIMENDEEHAAALDKTGFWGAQGAGCLFMSRKTGRFLVSHRSKHVEQPGTWGTWGGAIDPGEDPEEAVRREAQEEAGYRGPIHAIPLYVFKKGTFRYSNFLLIVDNEFKPVLDWETQGYRWCEFGDWPTPMHFGLVSLLNDAPSVAKMQEAMRTISKANLNEAALGDLRGRFRYVTNCVNGPHGSGGEAIHEMTERSRDISYAALLGAVGRKGLAEVFPSYDWSRRPMDLTMQKDYHVRYYRSVWRGIPCVYVVHSAIEYIFTLDGKLPEYDPAYD